MKGMKLLLVTALVLGFSMSLFAAVPADKAVDSKEIIKLRTPVESVVPKNNNIVATKGVLDTLTWLKGVNVNTNFGGWDKDYFIEYFVPSADGILHTMDFHMSDLPDQDGGSMSISIYGSNYAWPEISTVDVADGALIANCGYYDEDTGYEPFYAADQSTWVFGGINTNEGAVEDKIYDPLGDQLWPAFGAASADLPPNEDDLGWVNVDLLAAGGNALEFMAGDTFIVMVRFNGDEAAADAAEWRIGFYSATFYNEPMPSMKFYGTISSPNGRMGLNDWGWYIRSYVWDWYMNVEYTGDRGPVVQSYDQLATTLSTSDREVTAVITDDNPSGGDAGVASAMLYYSIDGADFVGVAMTNTSGDEFSATIPGQTPGTNVVYYIWAEDVGGLTGESLTAWSYNIFEVTSHLLFAYDTDEIVGLEWYYYYGVSEVGSYPYDLWDQVNGPVSPELLNNYDYVIHIMGAGPYNQPTDIGPVYKAWMDMGTAEAPKHLYISGQDYGYISGFADTTFADGTFEKDYLGIETLGPQDINYDNTVASYQSPYRVDPVAGDAISGFMADFAGDSLLLFYDPYYEIGANNWIDNLTPAAGATVCYTDPNNDGAAVAIYNEGETFKTSFWTMDPLSLSFYSPDTASSYYWALTNAGNPIAPIMAWFDASFVTSNEVVKAAEYKLNANYPNPFNPTTNISFTIPNSEMVTLTVFNMLGQEVANLVSNNLNAGTHSYVWNGRDFAGNLVGSGVYFYTLKAGDFTSTQKMVFMK